MKGTNKITMCGVMIALALVLSYMERFIPLQAVIPLPGIKLGLANIVTLIAMYLLGVKSAYAILILRCTLGAFFGGGVSGLMFSLTGGIMSLTVMAWMKNVPYISIYGVSILGAAVHNVGQIGVAMVLMQSVYIGAYLSWLLIAGIFTGYATGSAGAGILRILFKVRLDMSGENNGLEELLCDKR